MKYDYQSASISRYFLFALAILCLSVAFQSRVRASVIYTITDLGTLSGGTSAASDINANGQIVGRSDGSAFLWSAGTMHYLGNLGGGSSAYAINDNGRIVGVSSLPYGNGTYAVEYTGGGNVTKLWGGISPAAYDINNAGQIVGTKNTSGPSETGINQSGVITGWNWSTSGFAQGYILSNGVRTILPGAGRRSTYAGSINSSGQVVGATQDYNGLSHAYFYSQGVATDLGSLNGLAAYSSSASDINDEGVIVGNANGYAFLYANGQLHDLNSLYASILNGWYLTKASAINNSGQIVGTGINPQGQQHAYLLSPIVIPEPNTIGTLFVASILLLKHRKHQRVGCLA